MHGLYFVPDVLIRRTLDGSSDILPIEIKLVTSRACSQALATAIGQCLCYAVSTHVKTEVALDDGRTRAPADWDRVFKMFAAHAFRGYMGLEYEAAGDPATTVPGYLRRLKELGVKYSD